jgi:predicted nucleotide-binding protein
VSTELLMALETRGDVLVERKSPDPQKVFVAFRQHNNEAKKVMDQFLRLSNLTPKDIDNIKIVGRANTIANRLEQAFQEAQAFLILLTADDYSYLRPAWNQHRLSQRELHPRQNVVLEAGMAIGMTMPTKDQQRVILVQMIKPNERTHFSGPSNWTGLHFIELNDEEQNHCGLRTLTDELNAAGCAVA